MKKRTIKKVIKVDMIDLTDDFSIEKEKISEFIRAAYNIEDTVDKTGYWTEDYLYFDDDEAELESYLLENEVVKLPKCFSEWNKKVDTNKNGYYNHKKYYLGKNYFKFVDDFYKLIRVR